MLYFSTILYTQQAATIPQNDTIKSKMTQQVNLHCIKTIKDFLNWQEFENQNKMFVLGMKDNNRHIYYLRFFSYLIVTCPETRVFDSFVLQLRIDKHDRDKTTVD